MSLSDLFNSRHSYRILAFVGRSTATAARGPRLPICVNEWRQQPPTQAMTKSLAVAGRSQPWLALQVPLQDPWEPWPLHLPPPRPFESRPDPLALWPPVETLTLTWPDGATRPEALTDPPPR